jgi:hypothetical protein
VFQAVIAVVNCIKNSPLRRLFAKLYDDMEADTQYSYVIVRHPGSHVAQCFTGYRN